ncbi:hypothetical protein Bca52824_040807 [Brassica carinata]|uniref:Uncharacterized protein n=1 Tax=Brassica carinata TaxID=52824 RepID=A0A8X7RVH2_BRACI|nr:hypothetical protein Bca52824_040807 [Brassica carinata]
MNRPKTSAKKNTQEEDSSQREKQRPKKWDKSDTTHYNNMKNEPLRYTTSMSRDDDNIGNQIRH